MIKKKKLLFTVLLAIVFNTLLQAQVDSVRHDYEVSVGLYISIYQSVFSFQGGSAFETSLRKQIGDTWGWQIGARLGFKPALPEGFVRLFILQHIGIWQPTVGFEIGITRRSYFDQGKIPLREMRAVTERDISPYYIAIHTAPLSFQFSERWRLSFLELQFGTHLGHIGRTLRGQMCIISAGATL